MSDSEPQRVVIVGAGLAGLRVAENLRRLRFPGEIVVVGDEHHLPYDRPPLTKQVLRGERDATPLRDEYDSLNVSFRTGARAVALDAAGHEITLADGDAVSYDVLVIATGASPRTLPGQQPLSGVHSVGSIEDALALREALARAGEVVIVGAGFVGCEVAASSRHLGHDVTVLEAGPAPLSAALGLEVAQKVADLHQRHGVRLRTGTGVRNLVGDDAIEGVELAGGELLPASLAVVALGARPDLDWLENSGIEITNGIVCSAAGETSIEGVYALGDAAAWWHPLAGGHRRVEHFTTAVDQAKVVAHNIVTASGEERLENLEVPYFWSDQYDIKIQAYGFLNGSDDVHIESGTTGRLVALYSRGGVLTGALGFSSAAVLLKLRALIGKQRELEEAIGLLNQGASPAVVA